ncbi:MAG: 50S ribosomal protein L9 [Nitrospinota bacterium]|nr:50S ribosomal protein L9 [Nitrospinota bacterium]
MKVILKEYVPNLGDAGDQVVVAAGYARNYLLPKKIAFEATVVNMKTYENNLKQRARKLVKIHSEAEEKRKQLEGVGTLEFIRKAGEMGKLFGSVTSGDVCDALKEKGFEIDKKRIAISSPIKALGETSVQIKLHPKVTAVVKVNVVAEEPKAEEHPHDEMEAAAQATNQDASGQQEQAPAPEGEEPAAE